MKKSEITWAQAVNQARVFLETKSSNQLQIAELAIRACEVRHGGDSRNSSELFTLKKFSEDSGIHYKTLTTWVVVYRKSYAKMDDSQRNGLKYVDFYRIANQVAEQSTKKDVREVAQAVVSTDRLDYRMRDYLEGMRSFLSNLSRKNAVYLIKKETMEEALFFATQIEKTIKEVHPEIKPVNNDIAYGGSTRNVRSGLAAIDRSLDLSAEKVYRHLLKFPDLFVSPTKIGKFIGQQNENSQTSWALLRLNKLIKFGLVEKNSTGHYRALKPKKINYDF